MEKGIWLEIEELYKEFQQLGISQSVDYEKYYLYSLITHSTAIEGSTLTEMDAQLLFDEGVTAKGKPLKLQDVSNEQLEENVLSIYAKLYHKYESDKKFIPEDNLMEVKFEDFEADAMGMTENIYQSLSIPGFAEARSDIEKYVGGKKGYKKNKYKYDDRTIRLVEENWDFALKQWDYNL